MNEGEDINSMDALWKNIGYKEVFILLFVLHKNVFKSLEHLLKTHYKT